MIVKAYNNGAHNRNGAGYGFKVSIADRDEHFKQEWSELLVDLPGVADPVVVRIEPEGFWSEAGQALLSQDLGRWLRRNGLAPWPLGNPPVFILEPVEGNHFRVEKAHKASSKL